MKTKTRRQNTGLKNRSDQLSTPDTAAAQAPSAPAQTERQDKRLPIDREQRTKNRTLPTSKVLNLLLNALPDVYGIAEVVGKWIFVQFTDQPTPEIRQQLAQLGFHWNRERQAWQHPCGIFRKEASATDPRQRYGSYFAADVRPA